jgi:DHA1 family inner membrane transport protein
MIGVGSLAGLVLGGRAADRGAGKTWILSAFSVQAVAMTLHMIAVKGLAAAGWPSWILVSAATLIAAGALFSVMPVIQSRLVQATGGAPAALAINSSVIALGQALGSSLGGVSLGAWGVPAIPATALSLSLAGLMILSVAFSHASRPSALADGGAARAGGRPASDGTFEAR